MYHHVEYAKILHSASSAAKKQTFSNCHSEQREESFTGRKRKILHCVQDDKLVFLSS